MKFQLNYIILLFSLCFWQVSVAQLEVSSSSNANDLMDVLLGENAFLSYSNASITGADGASGTYANADFGVGEGVILTTGVVDDAPGPNTMLGNSGINGSEGDSDLDDLTGISTQDAVYLQADLTPEGESIQFSFVFASEDYNEYVCSPFFDALGFFIDGGEYENQNFALVPDSELLINPNTINDGNSGTSGSSNPENCAPGGLDNADLFVDNEGGTVIEYDGRSVVLTVSIPVTPSETYSFKWAIADGVDELFDSAVFLEAGSLVSDDPDCTAEGGELSIDGPTVVCKSDGEDDIINLILEGAEGENQTFVVTWANGEIFMITDNTEFNLEGVPGNGICLFWHLSWDGEIEGLEMGENAFDITGDCFDLSNPVEVAEYFTDGGDISTDDNTSVCVGEDEPIDVDLDGDIGQSGAWVITDDELNILALPEGPPFSFADAEPGTCLIWYLSWSGELEGAEVGENAADLSGDCFDLSNSIEVVRSECGSPNITGSSSLADSFMVVPNPTDGNSDVVFVINDTERVIVEVYDSAGRLVETLFNQVAESGQTFRLDFDGTHLPNGVYICRMTDGTKTEMKKFLIAR